MNVSDFRNVAFSQGNVKIKTDDQQQNVVASNSFKGRAVTWMKNAVGARTEKNVQTLNAFEKALHNDGNFDHDEVTNIMAGLRHDLKGGHKTLTARHVQNVLCQLGDKETLQRRNAAETERMNQATNNILDDLVKEYGGKLERNADKLASTLEGLEQWDETMAEGSGPLRNMTTIMQASLGFVPRAQQLQGHVDNDMATLKELFETPVAGKKFSQWGTTGTFEACGQEFPAVREALLEHAQKIQPVAQRINAAIQEHMG